MADSTIQVVTTAVPSSGSSSEDNQIKSIVVSMVLGLVLCASIALNTILLVVWCKTPRLRRPPNYLLVTLATADLVAAVFWCIPSLTAAAGWDWILGDGFCTFQGILSTWCYVMTTTTFMTISLEKFLKLVFPSKHPQAFYKTIVIILLLSMGLYSGVIALFPVMTWGDLDYIRFQAQCHFLFEKSVSHLTFMFAVTFCLPLLITCCFYAAAALKVWYQRRKQSGTDGKLVLEENKEVPSKSFGQMLKQLEESYKNAPQRKHKPKLGTEIVWDNSNQGNQRKPENNADPDSSASEMSEAENQDETFTDYAEGRRKLEQQKRMKQRVYLLRRRDIRLTLVTFIMCLIYLLIWLPFWIVSFYWVYQEVSEGLHTFFTIFTYLGIVYKPLMYLAYVPFRQAAGKVLRYGKKNEEISSPAYVEQVDEGQSTEEQGASEFAADNQGFY